MLDIIVLALGLGFFAAAIGSSLDFCAPLRSPAIGWTEKALRDPSAAAAITAEERRAIDESSASLRAAIAGSDYKLMRARIDELNAATNNLAENLMNGALQTALEGKRLDDVGG